MINRARNIIVWSIAAALFSVLASSPAVAAAKKTPTAAPAAATLVDINNATEKELESLPGVGKATAAKIVAGRPYASVDDLAKAGVSKATIAKITPLVTVGAAAAAAAATLAPATANTGTKGKGGTSATQAAASPASGALVDINSATEKELDALPGVGKATAEKIIAGRPYASVDDLAKAGVPKATIAKLAGLATVSSAAATTTSKVQAQGATAAGTTGATEAATQAQVPPVKGMVWVNTGTGVYHYEGDEWYGKTKQGKFLTEADAIKAGYHASKSGPKPK
jgi:competence protein ComEA